MTHELPVELEEKILIEVWRSHDWYLNLDESARSSLVEPFESSRWYLFSVLSRVCKRWRDLILDVRLHFPILETARDFIIYRRVIEDQLTLYYSGADSNIAQTTAYHPALFKRCHVRLIFSDWIMSSDLFHMTGEGTELLGMFPSIHGLDVSLLNCFGYDRASDILKSIVKRRELSKLTLYCERYGTRIRRPIYEVKNLDVIAVGQTIRLRTLELDSLLWSFPSLTELRLSAPCDLRGIKCLSWLERLSIDVYGTVEDWPIRSIMPHAVSMRNSQGPFRAWLQNLDVYTRLGEVVGWASLAQDCQEGGVILNRIIDTKLSLARTRANGFTAFTR